MINNDELINSLMNIREDYHTKIKECDGAIREQAFIDATTINDTITILKIQKLTEEYLSSCPNCKDIAERIKQAKGA